MQYFVLPTRAVAAVLAIAVAGPMAATLAYRSGPVAAWHASAALAPTELSNAPAAPAPGVGNGVIVAGFGGEDDAACGLVRPAALRFTGVAPTPLRFNTGCVTVVTR